MDVDLMTKIYFIHTSLECNLGAISVCSPDELNVHWNVSAGGDASTSHRNCTVSCFNAPNSSSLSIRQTGASFKKIKVKNFKSFIRQHDFYFIKLCSMLIENSKIRYRISCEETSDF